jgi:hypothetical protein
VRPSAISHAEARRRGWERMDPRPWGKLEARWQHTRGWRLDHCGHPTALWPWCLYAPDGAMYFTGARAGQPELGLAWGSLRDAMDYVDEHLRRAGLVAQPAPSPMPRASNPAQLALDFGDAIAVGEIVGRV